MALSFECREAADDILYLYSIADRIEDNILLMPNFGLNVAGVGENLDHLVKEMHLLRKIGRVSDDQIQGVEQRVQSLKRELPVVTGEYIAGEKVRETQTVAMLAAADQLKESLAEALLEGVVRCECGKG